MAFVDRRATLRIVALPAPAPVRAPPSPPRAQETRIHRRRKSFCMRFANQSAADFALTVFLSVNVLVQHLSRSWRLVCLIRLPGIISWVLIRSKAMGKR